jgi:hypothetical protein
MVFALAKILCLEKLRQADDMSALRGGISDARQGLLEVLFRIGATRHLHKGCAEFFWGHLKASGAERIA